VIRVLQTRLLSLIPTVLGVGVLVFFIVRLIPGDAVDAMLNSADTAFDPAVAASMRRLFGLDRPIQEQFWNWFTAVLRGDLGTSIQTRRPVLEEIMRAFPVTFELAIGSLLLGLVIAIPAGVLSAQRRGGWSDLAARLVALLGLSLPNFWLGLLLIYLFAVVLRVLPAGGYVPPDKDILGNLRSAVLPMVTLGTALAAISMRQTRSAVLEVLTHDYVRTARAKGLGEAAILYRHALRNSLIPVITVVGLQLGRLLGGTVIIEQIFAWPGLGQITLRAINGRDFPMVQGGVLFLALFFVLTNVIVDASYVLLDPRLKRE
jgi:peptide/nickel transport system permease protein